MVCYDAIENFYVLGHYRYVNYGGFSGYLTAFFQNLIGNAITLTRYQTMYQDLDTAGDTVGVARLTG